MAAWDVADELRNRGHRVTRSRLAVWRALEEGGGHRTAEELAEVAQRDEPGLNLASVYRSLALFEELGLARQSRIGDADAARWEVAHPDEHFHLVCTACGVVDHHVGDLVARIREHLDDGHGFEAATVDLTVRGRCAACRHA